MNLQCMFVPDSDINARLDAVTEIMDSDSQQLRSVCDMLGRTPDLERGLASIYHKKVRDCSTFNISNIVIINDFNTHTHTPLHVLAFKPTT